MPGCYSRASWMRQERVTAAIWKTLLIAEKTFRRFDAPELLADVANGVVYVDGMRQRAWPRPRPEPF